MAELRPTLNENPSTYIDDIEKAHDMALASDKYMTAALAHRDAGQALIAHAGLEQAMIPLDRERPAWYRRSNRKEYKEQRKRIANDTEESRTNVTETSGRAAVHYLEEVEDDTYNHVGLRAAISREQPLEVGMRHRGTIGDLLAKEAIYRTIASERQDLAENLYDNPVSERYAKEAGYEKLTIHEVTALLRHRVGLKKELAYAKRGIPIDFVTTNANKSRLKDLYRTIDTDPCAVEITDSELADQTFCRSIMHDVMAVVSGANSDIQTLYRRRVIAPVEEEINKISTVVDDIVSGRASA
ncbi:MAG: hypothetical protein JWO35_442 [Candidatus Saccharibacteria bacterium]|nr:hypothetical protein [Candidatus Saccharibacteria bacterium]